MAIDKVLIAYEARIKKLETQMNSAVKAIEKPQAAATKSTKSIEKSFSGLGNTLKGVGTAIAGAFAVERIISFGVEAVKLASQAEGVKLAFDRLNSPGLLDKLRKATRGTVSDLELMQQAVRAENFQIPLERLGTLLEFARRRATATGESVQFLTESIVAGIGRKSPLILDNLGISAARLSAEFKRTGDFAQAVAIIVDEELQDMGDDIDTTANKLSRLSASWDNFKVSAGNALIAVGAAVLDLIPDITAAQEQTELFRFATENLGIEAQKLQQGIAGLSQSTTEFGTNLAKGKDEINEASIAAQKFGVNINQLIDVTDEGIVSLTKLGAELISTLTDLSRPATVVAEIQERTVKVIEAEITAQKNLIKEQTNRKDIIPIQEKIIKLDEEIARLLGVETEAEKELAKAKAERKKADEEQLKDFLELQERIEDVNNREAQAVIDLAMLRARTEKEAVDAVIAQRDRDIEHLKLTKSEVLVIEEQAQQAIDQIRQDAEDQRRADADASLMDLRERQEKFLLDLTDFSEKQLDVIRSSFSQIMDGVLTIISAVGDLRNAEIEKSQQQLDRISGFIQQRIDEGITSEEEGAQIIADIRKRQFEIEKKQALRQLKIDTAVGIIKGFSKGLLIGSITAGILIATASKQRKIIESQRFEGFAKGKEFVEGPGTGTSDSVVHRLSKGERVITAKANRDYYDPLHDIHIGKFDKNWIKKDVVVNALQKKESLAANMIASAALQNFDFDTYNLERNQKKAISKSDMNTDKIVKAIKDTTANNEFMKSRKYAV